MIGLRALGLRVRLTGAMQAGPPQVQLRRRSGVLEPVTARGYTQFHDSGG